MVVKKWKYRLMYRFKGHKIFTSYSSYSTIKSIKYAIDELKDEHPDIILKTQIWNSKLDDWEDYQFKKWKIKGDILSYENEI